jgi:hypothetical protein
VSVPRLYLEKFLIGKGEPFMLILRKFYKRLRVSPLLRRFKEIEGNP